MFILERCILRQPPEEAEQGRVCQSRQLIFTFVEIPVIRGRRRVGLIEEDSFALIRNRFRQGPRPRAESARPARLCPGGFCSPDADKPRLLPETHSGRRPSGNDIARLEAHVATEITDETISTANNTCDSRLRRPLCECFRPGNGGHQLPAKE
jgi:hypothetical protein